MKIPKRIENLIERRSRLASDLNSIDYELAKWLEEKGLINEVEECDIRGGCEMYVNPHASADRIREIILRN